MNESIKTRDNRLFNADGSIREDKDAPETTPPSDSTPSSTPEIDFNTFILSLASSVQIALGSVPHPITQKTEINLSHAKQTIDILGMIETKTHGNLNPDESGLLKHILYQLRMQYIEQSKK